MRKRWARAIAWTLLAAATAAAQEETGRQGDTVSFELQQNVIFVEGRINGQGPFTFLFDTGASVTVLRRQTAERLGLEVESPGGGERGLLEGLLRQFGLAPQLADLESIALGRAEVRDLEVVVMNVPQAELPLAMAGIHYDGILGYNFISQFETTINYRERTIRLTPVDYDPGPALPGLAPGRRAPRPPAGGRREPPPRADRSAWIGFSYRSVGADEANEIGVEGGVVVGVLAEGSPAQRAGLRSGDVILEIDGRPVRGAEDYRALVRGVRAGQRLQLEVLRDRRRISLVVEVASRR